MESFFLNCNKINLYIKKLQQFFKKQINFNKNIKMLENRNYIYYANKLLAILKKYGLDNFNIKLFNILILIKNYPYKILINYDKKELINNVTSFFNYINNFDIYNKLCILSLLNKIRRFNQNFQNWLNLDKYLLIENLTKIYYQFDNFINNIDDKSKIILLEQKKDYIIKKIKKINGHNIFKKFTPICIDFDEKSIEKIKNLSENNYFKLLEEDLNQTPIKIDFLLSIIKEIKTIIYNLKFNDIEYLVKLEKNINLNNIKKYRDIRQIIVSINYLFILLIKFNTKIKNKHKMFKNDILSGLEISEYVPKYLKILLNEFYILLNNK